MTDQEARIVLVRNNYCIYCFEPKTKIFRSTGWVYICEPCEDKDKLDEQAEIAEAIRVLKMTKFARKVWAEKK